MPVISRFYGLYNLVSVSKTLHKHLHTSAYHAAVFAVLYQFKNSANIGGYWSKRDAILSGILFIGATLLIASYML